MLLWTLGIVDGKVVYSSVFHTITQALNNRYVVNGCEPTRNGLSIMIANGQVMYDGIIYDVPETTISIAQPSVDEVVLVVWDYNAGNPSVTSLISTSTYTYNGREYVKAPVIGDYHIPLALAVVRAGATSIADNDFYDVRLGVKLGGDTGDSNIDYTAIDSNLIPVESDAYDIGSETYMWKDAYFSGTVWIGKLKLDNPDTISL